ncbi:MAG: CvpA family protein [Alphaproteobacteria bacterium]
MTILDGVVLAVVLLSGILAFARGMVREVFSLAAWILAGIAVLYGLPPARPYAREYISHPLISDIATGAVIFIVVLVVATLIGSAIAGAVKKSTLSPVDRALGFCFGVVRGAILVSLAYLLLGWAFRADEQPKWIADAKTKPLLETGSKLLADLAPAGFLEMGAQTIKDAKDKLSTGQELNKNLEKLKTPADPKSPDKSQDKTLDKPATPAPTEKK